MNNREFRRYLNEKRLERLRQEALAENAALKKPPATAKTGKAKRTRSA